MRQTQISQPEHTIPQDDPAWSHLEASIEAFEIAWQQGQAPAIGDFLRGSGPLRRAMLIELVHADLEFRLKSGESTRVEDYLARYPELAGDRSAALELIGAEYELRKRHGGVESDEYLARFPDYAPELMANAALTGAETRIAASPTLAATRQAWPDVPGYEILSEIGRGGMGVVYKAREPKLGRNVALKFLPAEYSRDADRLDRFVREARTASGLNHPHICTVHALGEHEGRPFIVMEFIEGRTLHALLGDRPMVEEATRHIRQAAGALAAAHAAGVVHRDIKPENIMLRADGYVKVLDFGLARRLLTLAESESAGENHTDPATLLGTVAYMSPEQARGAAANSASDVFSLGIVLYQLLTSRHPFEAESPLGMLTAIATRQPLPPSRHNRDVPKGLDGLVGAMIHKDARLRPTAAEVGRALGKQAKRRELPADRGTSLRPIIHRQPELTALRAALSEAESGRGAIVCVAGEPGIGKTTLVEDFLGELESSERDFLVARGQCSERLAESEAYLPVIDALENLLRGDPGASVSRAMQVIAPTWFGQITQAPSSSSLPRHGARATSQQAMLREFCNLLDETSRLATLVLLFEDVHWADTSTVDLLAHFGHHCRRLRVLAIITYRPTELLLGPHPFHRVKLELVGKGVCSDLPIGFLNPAEIDEYLALVFPGHAFPADFADAVYQRTEGNPLFVSDLLSYLRDRGVISESGGRWSMAQGSQSLGEDLPASVRSMIERKLDRLGDGDRRLVSAASVQGHGFDSAALAGALELDAAEVEERLQVLDRVHGLVRLLDEQEFPDGTLTRRYRFVHVLYQQALYSEVAPTRRIGLAIALALTLERRHGDETSAAAELACLYEVGRDFASATRQLWIAAQNAARVFAHREAIMLAERALRLLDALPASSERAKLELSLQTTLGLQLQITKGYAAPEAERAYTRARELYLQDPQSPPEFAVLWGLWLCHKVRSELAKAQVLAEELMALARRVNEPALALQAHQALGITALCRGDQTAAQRNVEQAAAIYDPARHGVHSVIFGQDPGVICKAYGAVVLWLLGFPDTAVEQSETAIRMSEGLSPTSQAIALYFASTVYQLCRDGPRTLERAGQAITISEEHGLPFWLAGSTVLNGWALAETGSLGAGLAGIQEGLRQWRSTGSVTYETYYLGLLAEIAQRCGELDQAQRTVDEALALAARTGEGLYEAELFRLRGEIALASSSEVNLTTHTRALKDFRRSFEIAGEQEVRSLALRSAMSLAHLARRSGEPVGAQALLASVYASFTEGFATQDLQDAQALVGRQ